MKIRRLGAVLTAAMGFIAAVGSAKASTLFANPVDNSLPTAVWCDPCSSGNTGYRVWDSFILANDSTLQSLRWNGRAADPMTLGVVVEIALLPYGQDIFSANYASGSITRVAATNPLNDVRRVSLPDIMLAAGTYWLTVHGPSTTEQQTWLGQTETAANGDNSLIQFGPDPDNPQSIFPRNMDARFELDGIETPIPAALPLFATGLGALGLMGWRRKKKSVYSNKQ
jgi:hypothetical protein